MKRNRCAVSLIATSASLAVGSFHQGIAGAIADDADADIAADIAVDEAAIRAVIAASSLSGVCVSLPRCMTWIGAAASGGGGAGETTRRTRGGGQGETSP